METGNRLQTYVRFRAPRLVAEGIEVTTIVESSIVQLLRADVLSYGGLSVDHYTGTMYKRSNLVIFTSCSIEDFSAAGHH